MSRKPEPAQKFGFGAPAKKSSAPAPYTANERDQSKMKNHLSMLVFLSRFLIGSAQTNDQSKSMSLPTVETPTRDFLLPSSTQSAV